MNFTGTKAKQSKWDQSSLGGAIFDEAVLDGSTWLSAKLTDTSFSKASLKETVWDGALLTRCDFRGADLRGSNLLTAAKLVDCLLDVQPHDPNAPSAVNVVSVPVAPPAKRGFRSRWSNKRPNG